MKVPLIVTQGATGKVKMYTMDTLGSRMERTARVERAEPVHRA